MEGVTDQIRAGRSDGMFSARDVRETLAIARADGDITGEEYGAVETALTDLRGDVARFAGSRGRSVDADSLTPEMCDELARTTRDSNGADFYRRAGESLRNMNSLEQTMFDEVGVFDYIFH